MTNAVGIDKAVAAYEKLTGRKCNCGARQALLNNLVPYKTYGGDNVPPWKK